MAGVVAPIPRADLARASGVVTGGLIAVSTYNSAGASTRVRVYDWLRHLGLTATRVEYASTADNSVASLLRHPVRVAGFEASRRRLVDAVRGRTLVLSRHASPFSSGGLEARLLTAAARGVYDFDDALYADVDAWSRRVWSKSKLWRRCVESADVVIAGNEILATEAQRHSAHVAMVPSCVEPADYDRKADYEIGDVPRAVWMGSPATESFLQEVAPALLRLHSSRRLRLSVVSRGSAPLGDLDAMVDRFDWSPSAFGKLTGAGDFGIMPLPDAPYTRGKCSYKLLQYAAAGLPAVGSAVGVNVDVLRRTSGRAASGTDEWVGAMESILDASVAQRAAIGQRAYDGVVAGFSFGAWAATWRELVDVEGTAA